MADSTHPEDIAQSWIRKFRQLLYDPGSVYLLFCAKCETHLKHKKTFLIDTSGKKKTLTNSHKTDFYYDLTFSLTCVTYRDPKWKTSFSGTFWKNTFAGVIIRKGPFQASFS